MKRFAVLHEIERLGSHRRVSAQHPAALRRHLAAREPHFFTDDRNRTHPGGYEIGKLGPPKLVAAEKKRPGA